MKKINGMRATFVVVIEIVYYNKFYYDFLPASSFICEKIQTMMTLSFMHSCCFSQDLFFNSFRKSNNKMTQVGSAVMHSQNDCESSFTIFALLPQGFNKHPSVVKIILFL